MELGLRLGNRVILLGPDPANGSYSTFSYFSACATELSSLVGEISITASSPVGADTGMFDRASRAKVWARDYIVWPFRLRGLEGDAYHVVDQGLAWYGRIVGEGLRLVTVHDLIAYMTYLRKLPFAPLSWRRRALVVACMREIAKANHVFAISECTASALIRYVGIDSRKISVTPNYAHKTFRMCSDCERAAARARLFGNSEFVIVCVGSSAEYKNRPTALRAFSLIRKRYPGAELHIIGGKASQCEIILTRELRLGSSVHYWGLLPLEEVMLFYNAADVLIFPSIYEGFGLPPLEAMQCGCPVVATCCASVKEVVGEAALTVDDPLACERMAECLEEVLKDASLRRDLRNLGLRQALRFNVERSMQGIAEVYRRLLA